MTRTGHWIAHYDNAYLERRSTQPTLVWGPRTSASAFRTRREAEQAVQLSGVRVPLREITFEIAAMTHAGFSEWRRGEREPVNAR